MNRRLIHKDCIGAMLSVKFWEEARKLCQHVIAACHVFGIRLLQEVLHPLVEGLFCFDALRYRELLQPARLSRTFSVKTSKPMKLGVALPFSLKHED